MSALILVGCTKTSTPPGRTPTTTFPLTTGTEWHYNGRLLDIPFNDSSLADTIWQDISRSVLGPDTLFNLTDLVVVDDTVISNFGALADTSIFRNWLKIDDQKLKRYAHSSFSIGSDPDPYVYDVPHVILDFPLTAGKEWVSYWWDFGVANSAVVGIEQVNVEPVMIVCDVVLTHVIDESEEDTISAIYEWYSDEGLIRKEIDYGIRELLDENGDVLDSARSFEVWELTEFEIQEQFNLRIDSKRRIGR
jgi:hypothetical protein